MKVSDKNKFASAFQTMCEIFDKKNTKIMVAGYFTALEPFPIIKVEAAISQAIKTCRFFPKPVELIDLIPNGKPPRLESRAEIEADKIICHFRRYGSSREPKHSDPVTEHLMTKRWPYANWSREVLESALVWWKKDFITAYLAYCDADKFGRIECTSGAVLELIDGIGG